MTTQNIQSLEQFRIFVARARRAHREALWLAIGVTCTFGDKAALILRHKRERDEALSDARTALYGQDEYVDSPVTGLPEAERFGVAGILRELH
jgi:hypothetical protein